MADTYKIILLKEWETVCKRVKKGLKRLGHDIVIVPSYDTLDCKEKEDENFFIH